MRMEHKPRMRMVVEHAIGEASRSSNRTILFLSYPSSADISSYYTKLQTLSQKWFSACIPQVCIIYASISRSAVEEGRAKVDQIAASLIPPRSPVPSSNVEQRKYFSWYALLFDVASLLQPNGQTAQKLWLGELEVAVAQDPSLGGHRRKQNRTRAWRCKACGEAGVSCGLGAWGSGFRHFVDGFLS